MVLKWRKKRHMPHPSAQLCPALHTHFTFWFEPYQSCFCAGITIRLISELAEMQTHTHHTLLNAHEHTEIHTHRVKNTWAFVCVVSGMIACACGISEWSVECERVRMWLDERMVSDCDAWKTELFSIIMRHIFTTIRVCGETSGRDKRESREKTRIKSVCLVDCFQLWHDWMERTQTTSNQQRTFQQHYIYMQAHSQTFARICTYTHAWRKHTHATDTLVIMYAHGHIGRFSEAGLLEWMRFVIFCVRCRERSQRTSGPISE